MSGKSLFLDFINYVIATFLIGLTILFIISPGNFQTVMKVMQAIIPFSAFGILFLIKSKISRTEVNKKKADNDTGLTLNLTYMDKMKGELLVFILPIIIIVISFFGDTGYNINDFFQAAFAFLVMYMWQRSLFNKRS